MKYKVSVVMKQDLFNQRLRWTDFPLNVLLRAVRDVKYLKNGLVRTECNMG